MAGIVKFIFNLVQGWQAGRSKYYTLLTVGPTLSVSDLVVFYFSFCSNNIDDKVGLIDGSDNHITQ